VGYEGRERKIIELEGTRKPVLLERSLF